jgi:peptide/nickel transport system permease protein
MSIDRGADPIAREFERVAVDEMQTRAGGSIGVVWLLGRLLHGVITLVAVSAVVFVATEALPGDPAEAILGKNATPESVAALRAEMGIDGNTFVRYFSWLGDIATGDLGSSLAAHKGVVDLIGDRVINSLTLAVIAGVISIALSLIIGVATAVRRDRPIDHAYSAVSLALAAVPEFVIGMLLVMVFATTVFHLFPAVSLIPDGTGRMGNASAFVLPVATLVLVNVPYLSRLVRGSMIDVLESDYVEMARLKGLSTRRVVLRHALPNAVVPMIQGSALVLAYMAGGIVVVEYVFQFPGIGAGLTDAIAVRDLPVIQAITLLLAAAYVVLNLLADALTVYVSPRLRSSS